MVRRVVGSARSRTRSPRLRGYDERVNLDIPDEVRRKVLADGNPTWLDELPSVVGSLVQDWSLTLGNAFHGGHSAFVVAATLADGTAAVLKVGVPGAWRELGSEAAVLRLADGEGCARLLRDDLDRGALLLERLGASMYDVVPDPAARHDTLCDVAARLWRPVVPDVDLPTGADKAIEYAHLLPRLWEETGRACSRATVEDALACMERRRRAHDDRGAVLVHGDVHDMNALQAADGMFKLVDPGGLWAEPACDLGTIVRCNPDSGDDLRARTERLAVRSGVDETAIWEWGTIYRVTSGLYCRTIGFQPFGDLLLAEADRLTRTT
jgi:streptomycin 6-kinase